MLCCCGRDGFKVTSRSWNAGRTGPEGSRSQWGSCGAVHGVWRYSASWSRQGPAQWSSRVGGARAAQRTGVSATLGTSDRPRAPRASGSAGISLLLPAAAVAAHLIDPAAKES